MAQANTAFKLIRTLGSPPAVHSAAAAEHQRSHRSAVLCFQAHTDLLTKLTLLKAHRIVGAAADVGDVEVRCEHLQAVLHAIAEYVLIILRDTAENLPIGTLDDTRTIESLFKELTDEIVGALERSAEAVTENEECGGGSVS